MPPNILLDKMYFCGIRGCIHDWFRSYLRNRTQYTVFNNTASEIKLVHLGVPQDSILGSILFLFYINYIFNISDLLKVILFPDDSSMYMTGNQPTDIINRANTELSNFQTGV